MTFKEKFKKRYSKIIEDNELDLRQANRDILHDFLDLLRSEGLSYGRRYKYLIELPKVIKYLDGKNIEEWTKEDLIRLAGIINEQPFKESTKIDLKGAVKKLYKTVTILDKYEGLNSLYFWLYDKRNKFFSTNLDRNKLKHKEAWFTDEDIKKIINGTQTIRDKAMFAIFASQGPRPSECLGIQKKDIEKLPDGLQIKISGKTGTRFLFIFEGYVINAVNDWIKSMPKDQEKLFDFTDRRANDILKQICEIQGISKRATLYKLRKYSVTRDRIAGMTTGALEAKYGWVKGSNRVASYDKSQGIDYMREAQVLAGQAESAKPENKFKDKICTRCRTSNGFDVEYCKTCGTNLSVTRETLESKKNHEELAAELKKLREDFSILIRFAEIVRSDDSARKSLERLRKSL